jgi:hypothetical protein
MEHNDVRHRLSEYIDGSVVADEKAAIEAHLKTCRQCADALQELRKTIEHIKTVEEVDPPAWMTQKIMATVRAESEKKSWMQRLFFPLSIKLPIQTIAVVFLAIGAFYIYRNIQPSSTPSEAPMQELASGRSASEPAPAKDKLAKAEDAAPRAKKLPQAPAYKALDMKQEYEKPPLPMLQGKATAPAPAPAPAAPVRPAEQPIPDQREPDSLKAAAPQAGAPAAVSEQTADSVPNVEKKSKSAAPMQRALNVAPANAVGSVISVRVNDIDASVRELEQTVKRLGGSIQKKDLPNAKKVYDISINAQKLQQLKEKLEHIGDVKDEAIQPVSQDGQIVLRIEFEVK